MTFEKEEDLTLEIKENTTLVKRRVGGTTRLMRDQRVNFEEKLNGVY